MLNNKKINSWGKTFNKKVKILNHIDGNKIILPIGNLNSYGDSCIPKDHFAFEFGTENHINQTVINFLFLNKLRLFGVPGKANVTIGGAIASDVHGKDNLWGGPFSKNIESLELAISKDKKICASRTENQELFKATIGGLGLTGVITNIEFSKKLKPLDSLVETKTTKGQGLESMFEDFKYEESNYWSAWIDLMNPKNRWISFNSKELKTSKQQKELDNKNIHFKDYDFSINLSKKSYLENINNIYYFINRERIKKSNIFKTLYPIKSFLDTRIIAGKRGLIQIQFVVPFENMNKIYELLNLLIQYNNPLLCSVKRLNDGEGYLSFCKNGWTFAVDFPKESFNTKNLKTFFKKLNEVNGSIYLAKDSLLDEESFKLMYKQFNDWQKVVKFYDPKNIFQSEMSKRLGLKSW